MMLKQNILILAAVAGLAIAPLVIHRNGSAEFGGSDNNAAALVTTINPDYKPWFTPVWEPPSGEVASLLFSLQAALGAGLIGFYFGRRTAPSGPRRQEGSTTETASEQAR